MKRVVSLVIGAWLALSAPVWAAPEDVANDIAAEVVSPYCPGVTLHDCPSADAVELRTKIQTWLEDGASKQQVLDRLESEYGTTIHAAPEAKGTGLFAYLLPILGLVIGLVAIFFAARRWSHKRDDDPAPPPPSEEDHERVEAELAAFRSGG